MKKRNFNKQIRILTEVGFSKTFTFIFSTYLD